MVHRLYGLLVGIDDYLPPVPKLEGCVNDVDAIENYLRNRLDTQHYELHLQRLTTNGQDEMPTRKAIIAGFEQHLSQATEQDVALFYYSGHGSTEPAPPEFWHLEPDRRDQTLVCWDSRTTDWDLADKELGYLIAQVAKKNPHIIIILDSCHSGSGTRDIVPPKGVRHSSADRRSRSLEEFIFSLSDLEAIDQTTEKPSGWNLPQGRHILLSACRDRELASEYSGDGQQRGAFSYFLLDTLQKTNGSLTYRELFKRASTLVRSRIKDQSPQLEAIVQQDLELPFLGGEGAIAKRDPYFTLSYDNNRWVIDAGAVHGIPENTQLALYPQGTPVEQMKQLSVSVGEANVIEVQPHQSVVELITTPDDLTTDTVLNAVIISLPLPPLGVYFEGDEIAIILAREKLKTIGIGGKPSLYVRQVDNITEAQYRLLAQDSQYLITKPTDKRPLVRQLEEYTQINAYKAIANLEHIARWTTVLELESSPGSPIQPNAVKIQFYRPDGTEIIDFPLHLTYQYQGGKWKPPTFRLKLTNTSEESLFCTLLDLTERYAISAPFFPGNNSGVWIEPGQEIWAFQKKAIPASIPDKLWKQGVTDYQDVLKLIISTAEFDASLMCQNGLEQPKLTTKSVPKRNSTLNRLMQRVTTRELADKEVEEVDEWFTSQVTIITTRPRETVTVEPNTSTSLGMGVTLEPHPSLQATARLTTVSQSTRDVGTQILPTILKDQTQPFQFTASRGVDPGLSVLELQISDAESLNTVTRDNPLKLSVDKTLGNNEYVLPIAYDGDFFIPLGRGESKKGKTEIRLERLTDPLANKKKSLGGSIRIFFQKVIAQNLDLDFPYPILAAVEYGDAGNIYYHADIETVKEKVRQANKIVLFIHGIIGDTQSMVPCAKDVKIAVEGQEKPLNEIYDLVLAFDYENLNTDISILGQQLGQRLESVGLGANHGQLLHIIAHSMGGLVARSFIEQHHGNQVVQHLMMLGTPNAGSPWSTVQDWAFTALTLGLNGLSVTGFPLAALGNLLGMIEAIDINLDQMRPGSDFLNSLAASRDPQIPYTILAGNTSLIPPPDEATTNKLENLLKKLGQSTVNFPFLGQPNDIAVTVNSITNIPQGRSHSPHIKEVPCNHLVYFTHPDALQAIAEAIINTGILSVEVDDQNPDTTEPEAEITPVPVRPDTPVSEGISMSAIALVIMLIIVLGGGFWMWQQLKNQEPNDRDSSSSSSMLY